MSKPRNAPLDEARLIINTDRNAEYGEPYDNFQSIANMCTELLKPALKDGAKIEVHHVAMIMIAVKLSRMQTSPLKFDSWTDIAGYVGAGWEATAVANGLTSPPSPRSGL